MRTLPSWSVYRPLLGASADPTATRLPALVITGIYVLVSLIYGILSDAPWDDDCVVRYFHSQEVWSKPSHFFSMWNRPLFMIFFAPTAFLGRTVMMVEMIGIGAISGWILYRALEKLGARHAHWVLPFFFFQAFYFSVSRNFLTEPLAVAVICLGLHALVHQRWTLFAMLGGLLPLARLELVVVLPIWGVILLQAGQWKKGLWMAVPMVIVMVLGYFVAEKDSLLWLVDETLGKEDTKNRYGHKDFWHYFQRFAYVTGPVVFYFLVIGLLERLSRLKVDLFITLQGMAILLLYVIFSWKLNMGNAAGFLRNLIPLTPFVALLAFDGLQAWQRAMSGPVVEEAPAPVPVAEAVSRQDRKGQKRKAEASRKKPVKKVSGPTWWSVARIHVFSLVAVAVLYAYFSKALQNHHKISANTDHLPAYIGAGFALIGLLALIILRKHAVPRWWSITSAVLVAASALAFTAQTERPDAHLNPERKGLSELSNLYKDSYLREWPLYANHSWFFWPHDIGYPDPQKYRVLNKAALDTAEVHSIVLWENHYSHRLQGNVQLADMYKRKDMVELCHLVGRDHALTAGLFQKVDTVARDSDALRERFLKTYPNNVYAHYAVMLDHGRNKRHAEALAEAQRMVELDSTYTDGIMALGQEQFEMRAYDKALVAFNKAFKMDTALYTMHYSIGATYLQLKDYPKAAASVKRFVKRDKKNKAAYEILGASYYYQNKFDSAAIAFGESIRLDPKGTTGLLNRGSCYMKLNQLDKSLADYERALRIEPGNRTALLNKGVLLIQKGRKADGCAIMQQLAAAGDPNAIQQMATTCR
ncbi:MAG TPA: tetratricopeptide repeat protein [Flavobacteriales bacterium]|nr:tetratricopeptide repeat protein [Flavobacteriales bacterium]